MGYKIYRKCDEIPLCKFIDMYNGDLLALIIEGRPDEKELKDLSIQLIEEYNSIVGNKSLFYMISNQNRMLDYNSKLIVLEAAKNLVLSMHYEEASEVLNYVGIKMGSDISDDFLNKIMRNIDSLMGETKLRMEMLKHSFDSIKKSKDKPNFTRERVCVSTYFKMHIDPQKVTAAEYGYMVRSMINELNESKNYGKRN